LKIEDNIINTVQFFNETVQQAAWNATPMCSNTEIHMEYSPTIQEEIAEKRKLRKMWQINRCSVLKNKLNHAIKILKNLLFMDKNHTKIFK